MMKDTIQKMKENGMYDRIVKYFAEKKMENEGENFTKKNVKTIIEFEILKCSDCEFMETLFADSTHLGIIKLAELIMDAVEEQAKMDALDKVDPDALFEKVTGEQLPKTSEEEASANLSDVIAGVITTLASIITK